MGVIIVEKHVFYLEGVTQEVEPRVPRGKSWTVPEKFTRNILMLRHRRIPWEGALSIIYMHDNQLGGQPQDRMPTSIDFMRRYLLGKGYPHPKLIVADVPSPQYLMLKRDMANYLLTGYVKTRRKGWMDEHPIMYPHPKDISRDAWLPYDPTRPGMERPGRDVWKRELEDLFPGKKISVAQHVTKEGDPNQETIIPLGVAYRIRYFTTNEPEYPNAQSVPQIRARVNAYLQQAMTSNKPSTEWYVLGKFEPPEKIVLMPSQRSSFVKTYKGARLVPMPPKDRLVTRRMFIVQAKDIGEAKKVAEKHITQLMNSPDPQKQFWGLKLWNAWERGGHQVLGRQGWDMIRQKYHKLKEELYRRDLFRRVY